MRVKVENRVWPCPSEAWSSLNNRSHAIHPWLWPNRDEPILGSRYSPEIFLDVLRGNVPNGDFDSFAIRNRDAEDPFRQEHTFGVVPKRPMSEVGEECFRFVKPIVDRQIIFWLAAKFLRAVFRVFKWVSHD